MYDDMTAAQDAALPGGPANELGQRTREIAAAGFAAAVWADGQPGGARAAQGGRWDAADLLDLGERLGLVTAHDAATVRAATVPVPADVAAAEAAGVSCRAHASALRERARMWRMWRRRAA